MRKTICKAMCVLFPRLTASNSSSVGGREIELFTSVFTPNVLEAIVPANTFTFLKPAKILLIKITDAD